MSFAELSSLYRNAKKAPTALEEEKVLPGATVSEKLSKLNFTRKSNSQFASATALASLIPMNEQKTVAICLVIVDSLPHEAVWKYWAEEGLSESKYVAKIAIHAKYPDRIKSEWVREHLVPITYKPEWNSPEIIRAMLSVMNECLRDPHCGRFVFGTESCVPLYSLGKIGATLFEENVSWLNAFNRGKSTWETQNCFRSVNEKVIPPSVVWKCIPGWIMLTRKHAAEISVLTAKSCKHMSSTSGKSSSCLGSSEEADLVRAWGEGGTWSEANGNVWAPEEVFFPTMLSILGYLKEGGKDEVKRRSVTYAKFKKVGDANPISFTSFDAALLQDLRASGSLFGRKFGPGVADLARWKSLIGNNDSNQQQAIEKCYPASEKRMRDGATEDAPPLKYERL